MDKPLNILYLEDDRDFAELVRTLLEKEGLRARTFIVDNFADFVAGLEKSTYDIILSDYRLPTCNGVQALQAAQQKAPNTPFLLVSGVVGEETAVESLRSGARDYVPKTGLNRLVPAVQRAVKEVHEHTQRKQAETELARREKYFRALTENSLDVLSIVDPEGVFRYNSPSLKHVLGYEPEELAGRKVFELLHPDDLPDAMRAFERALQNPGAKMTHESRCRRRDGTWCHLEAAGQNLLNDPDIAGIVLNSRDVTERKRTEEQLKKAHGELAHASRLAGMAEVATSVLHNVGNVLNSVNVSVGLVSDELKKSKITYISRVATLLREHAADLGSFMANDTRGKQLPDYLAKLAEYLAGEQSALLQEMDLIRKNVDHIKDIVAIQQNYSQISGALETASMTDLVEDALRMNAGGLMRHEVRVVRDYAAEIPEMLVHKHRVLQILVNLIRNAKYACDESNHPGKCITLRVTRTDQAVRVAVIDNGVGIPEENLAKMFKYGFTTRKHGHGFGLHSALSAAREMGGNVVAESEGRGKGATFTLELPLQNPAHPAQA